jgi:hypothetical protein
LSINAVRLLAQATMATLDGLMQGDAMSLENKMLDKAWRGVEAMHLYIETHKLLYARKVRSLPAGGVGRREGSLAAPAAVCARSGRACFAPRVSGRGRSLQVDAAMKCAEAMAVPSPPPLPY